MVGLGQFSGDAQAEARSGRFVTAVGTEETLENVRGSLGRYRHPGIRNSYLGPPRVLGDDEFYPASRPIVFDRVFHEIFQDQSDRTAVRDDGFLSQYLGLESDSLFFRECGDIVKETGEHFLKVELLELQTQAASIRT